MKLLNCLDCHDIVSVLYMKERFCNCGNSSAILLDERIEYSGSSRILCINNDDYIKARPEVNKFYQWYVSFDGYNVVKKDLPDNLSQVGKASNLMSKLRTKVKRGF